MKLDWKNEHLYDGIDSLDYHALAFEFLKRKKEYQAAYAEYAAIVEEVEKDKIPRPFEWQNNDPRLWVLNPEAEEGETLEEWRRRVYSSNTKNLLEKPLHLSYGEKFGLRNAFPDPETKASDFVRFQPSIPTPIEPSYEDMHLYYEEAETDAPFTQRLETAVLVFDLLSPLPKQIEKAEVILTDKQEQLNNSNEKTQSKRPTSHKRKNIKEEAKTLLRAFDGNASGASNIAIGNILFPNHPQSAADGFNRSQTASNTIKRAKFYVSSKYRVIPFVDSDF